MDCDRVLDTLSISMENLTQAHRMADRRRLSMKQSLSARGLRVLASLAAMLWTVPAWATTYHVAQSGGADINDGSAARPFATISACAAVVQAGDTCTVHAGTYRETVALGRSGSATTPIRFEVAAGECATVTGVDPFTAPFTNIQGNVWSAPVKEDIQQMFSNGTIIWEAQWPNRTPSAIIDLPKGITGQGTGVQTVGGVEVSYLVDPAIPAGDWTGATVLILPGQRWQSDSRPVKAFDQATHTITLDTTIPWAEKSIQPAPANAYFLYGSPLALDVQDEWVVSKGSLLYYSTDDPANHALEYKKRPYAFNVTASYVEIVGFQVFGAAVSVKGDHNTVDSLTIEYPTHLRAFNAYESEGDVNRIEGDANVWKNSLIEKSGSTGLAVAGNGNRIENNIANDIDYQATNHAGFDMYDWQASYKENLFIHNTVNRCARSGIFQYGASNGRVLFNKVTDWAMLTNDMGGIYAWGTDGHGTEIAYNEVGGSTAFFSNGIYLDDRSKHFVIHHNYVHDSTFFGLTIKEENYFFNNTMANVGAPFLVSKDAQVNQWEHIDLAKAENNLTDGTLLVRVGVLPTIVQDYGYFEAQVHATTEWQHMVIPFASMHQPGWNAQQPFDLTSIQQIAFVPWTNGDFEFDVDNIRLEGATGLAVDDFESGGGANGLGGAPFGGGGGDGITGTSGTLSYGNGGPTPSTKYAHFAGTMVMGDSWGLFTETIPNKDLSAYSGLSFDIRGQLKALKLGSTGGGNPVQSHNASCSFTGAVVPACAIDQGGALPASPTALQALRPISVHSSPRLRLGSLGPRVRTIASCVARCRTWSTRFRRRPRHPGREEALWMPVSEMRGRTRMQGHLMPPAITESWAMSHIPEA
jgi:hypothetical protein